MTNGLMMDGWKDKRYAWRYMIGARGTSPVSYPQLDVVNTTLSPFRLKNRFKRSIYGMWGSMEK
jgi:hypothetical protein